MNDGPAAQLRVSAAHRAECTFGMGFYRLILDNGDERYCQTQGEVNLAIHFLGGSVRKIQRDGYCLDGDRQGDANTPDVVDAEWWLGLPQAEAMRQVGLEDAAEYRRVYEQIEDAVGRRNNRESQTGVHVPIVLKKRGRPLIDVLAEDG